MNADLTEGILIGKGYVYCFSTPGGINHRATSSSDILENKIPATLQTIGAIPNNQNILKMTWLSSTATKKTYQFADFIGILYADSTQCN
uniref:Uncharacterized protein n=1 Tax=Panagrolaimus davidi TaxID=227884 RepID=A0A914PQG3_9BILA